MTGELSPIDKAKFVAAKRAADFVEDGMRVGLGTGSTAAWLVRCLGEMVREDGLKIKGVPTSTRTAELAREVGIEVISLDEAKWLDLTIDGADEFDGDLNLIKGGGGALVAGKDRGHGQRPDDCDRRHRQRGGNAGRFPSADRGDPLWLADHAGAGRGNADFDGRAGAVLDAADERHAPFVTDEGNHILDLHLNRIGNARQLSLVLNQMPGVVENGLFIDICDAVVIGYGDGRVEVRDINEGTIEQDRLDFVETDNLFTDLAE